MPWRDLTSQPMVCDLIGRTLRHGRVHHSYLMIGEDAETEPIALAFARALNCEKNDGDFCGRCDSCRAIAEEKHPDVYHVRPESKSRRILITQIRGLERMVFLKAGRGRTKVALVHSADRLQEQAQDAFLKTLEEPPPQTVLLLLTEAPQLLRDTIISRCLRIPFRPGLNKEKTEHEKQIETWLSEFVSASASIPGVFRAYGLTGRVLGLLKKMREEKIKQNEESLDDPSLENMEPSQRERLKEQLEAQAQAEYIHERTRLLKTILQWYHQNAEGGSRKSEPETRNPASSIQSPGIDPRIVEILEKLAGRLNRNINEALAWEVATLQLAIF